MTKMKCQLLRGRKESGERQRGKEKENDKVEKVSETLRCFCHCQQERSEEDREGVTDLSDTASFLL